MFPNDKDLSYDNLSLVHNGGEAMNVYANLINLPEDERFEMRKALLEYCKLDTLAMVEILEKLREMI